MLKKNSNKCFAAHCPAVSPPHRRVVARRIATLMRPPPPHGWCPVARGWDALPPPPFSSLPCYRGCCPAIDALPPCSPSTPLSHPLCGPAAGGRMTGSRESKAEGRRRPRHKLFFFCQGLIWLPSARSSHGGPCLAALRLDLASEWPNKAVRSQCRPDLPLVAACHLDPAMAVHVQPPRSLIWPMGGQTRPLDAGAVATHSQHGQ